MVQNKTIKTKKTEIMKKNSNPVFNESFTFKLSLSSLDTANVTITAMQPQTGYKGLYLTDEAEVSHKLALDKNCVGLTKCF